MLNRVPALVAAIVTVLASIKLTQFLLHRLKRTDLKGPPSNGFLIGRSLDISKLTPNHGMIFEEWARDYGSVYRVPLVLGSSLIVICDIKAVAHILAKDTYTYNFLPIHKRILKATIAYPARPRHVDTRGDEHKKWRRKLVPSFSSTTIRGVTGVFYDAAYKLKAKWDPYFESATEVTIDVQIWYNHLSYHIIISPDCRALQYFRLNFGLTHITVLKPWVAGFGHDFKALDGSFSVMKVLEEFNCQEDDILSRLTLFIGAIFPMFLKFPTNQAKLIAKYKNAESKTANDIVFNELEKKKLSSTCRKTVM
ncbi:hypothetical protein JOM56_014552 [Amanita muscaria]